MWRTFSFLSFRAEQGEVEESLTVSRALMRDISTSLDMTEIAARFSASELDALFVLLQREFE